MARITLNNHATVLIDIDGVRILTDPTYARTVGCVAPRLQKPGIPFSELPPLDAILVSHNDYDHLHMRTLRRLQRIHNSIVCLPVGDGRYARSAGFGDVREMRWWDSMHTENFSVTCVPARHKSSRRFLQRSKQLCCGFVFERNGMSVYFAGDTGYGEHFAEIASRFELDAALLPIGAYKPHNWFQDIHLNPATAIRAFIDLRARLLIPIHWGTFKISDEPMQEPPRLLAEEAERLGVGNRVHILRNGESVGL